MRPNKFHVSYEDEDAFVERLCSCIEGTEICSQTVKGTKIKDDRLSDFREIKDVYIDDTHPDIDKNVRPDIRIHYEGDELPLVFDRSLSNPFYIECKLECHKLLKDAVQGLKYKWRNGSTSIGKYVGDSVVMACPDALYTSNIDEFFDTEREMWHLGLWFMRNVYVNNVDVFNNDRTIGMTLNEFERVLFIRNKDKNELVEFIR